MKINTRSHLRSKCPSCHASGTFLCGIFQDQHRDRLDQIGHGVEVQRGEYLFRQNSEAVSVYLIRRGVVMLERSSSDGKRQVLAFLYPGDFLGFSADGTHYRYSVSALKETELCAFQREAFISVCSEYPELKDRLGTVNNRALQHAMDHIFALGNKKAHERLCFFLFSLSRRQGLNMNQQLELCMSRQDIADYLGLTIETVSRAFARLKQDGLIRVVSQHQIEFLQPERMAQLAESS